MEFPGKNTRVDSHSLLQGDLPDPGTEPLSPELASGFLTTETKIIGLSDYIMERDPGLAQLS